MKTFKQYVNEQGGYPAADYDEKKDPDSEVKDYDPRSEGEDEFKKKHTKGKKKEDHPVAPEWQFRGGTKKDTSKKDRRISSPASGERDVVKQGTSDVDVKSGFGQSSYRRQDKEQGDKKMPTVRDSYNYGLDEAVIDDLRRIVKNGSAEDVEFKNGKSMEVDEKSAKTIVDAYDELSSSRRKNFEKLLEKGPSSFMKALDFASSV